MHGYSWAGTAKSANGTAEMTDWAEMYIPIYVSSLTELIHVWMM